MKKLTVKLGPGETNFGTWPIGWLVIDETPPAPTPDRMRYILARMGRRGPDDGSRERMQVYEEPY